MKIITIKVEEDEDQIPVKVTIIESCYNSHSGILDEGVTTIEYDDIYGALGLIIQKLTKNFPWRNEEQ